MPSVCASESTSHDAADVVQVHAVLTSIYTNTGLSLQKTLRLDSGPPPEHPFKPGTYSGDTQEHTTSVSICFMLLTLNLHLATLTSYSSLPGSSSPQLA